MAKPKHQRPDARRARGMNRPGQQPAGLAPGLLYRSGRSLTLWWLLPVVLAPVPLTAWLVLLPPEARLLAEFGSPGALRAWQAGLMLLSTILVWPMLWLSGRYVTRIERLADGQVRVQVWTWFGHRQRDWPARSGAGEDHAGLSALPGAPVVNAPWTGYRTPEGRRLVVDWQGEFPQGHGALDAVVSSGRS